MGVKVRVRVTSHGGLGHGSEGSEVMEMVSDAPWGVRCE